MRKRQNKNRTVKIKNKKVTFPKSVPNFQLKQNDKKLVRKNTKREFNVNFDDVLVRIKDHHDKNGGHPHVIMETIENKHVSVGLSTKPTKGKGSKNYKMEKSPLNDGKTSYMRRQGTVDYISEYKNKRFGMMTKSDYNRAKVYGERAKAKFFSKNKK